MGGVSVSGRLNEIEARADAATPGPWIQGEGISTSEYGVWARAVLSEGVPADGEKR